MKIETKTCVKVGISIFALYLAIFYWSTVTKVLGSFIGAAAPLLIGSGIAYIINILMSYYERRYFKNSDKRVVETTRRPVCMVAAILSLIGAVFLILVLVVPQLISCVKLIFAELPGALDTLVDNLDKLHVLPADIIEFLNSIDWQSKINQIIEVLTSGIGDVVEVVVNVATSVFSGIVTGFLSIIFAIYLLLSKDSLARQTTQVMKRYLRKSWYDKIMYAIGILDDCFHRYIVGQCTEAIILGILCALGMWILQLPYATMIGALIAFTSLIPVAGAYIGGAIGVFMIFTVSPIKAIIFVVFLVVLQQLEGNIIYPRVVGSSMGLPGFWVLAAVTVGGGVMGISGMLLGVPITAAIYKIVRNDVYGITPPPASSQEENTENDSQPQEQDTAERESENEEEQ